MYRAGGGLTLLLAAAICAPALRAQTPIPDAPPSDSAALADSARAAQVRFERLRRAEIRYGLGAGAGRCDERVGRYCLNFTTQRDDWWEPDPEPERLADGREELLELLERAARVLPGDGWIAGQRARYLVEAGRPDAWHDLPCRSEGWWCAALAGLAHHASGDFLASAESFAAALEAMDPQQRARWESLELLLDPSERAAYHGLSHPERAAFEARFWGLGDPLYLVTGNDRRTEHLSRLVHDRLLATSQRVDRMRWGDDMREILLRYGTAVQWEYEPPEPFRDNGRPLVARFSRTAREFLPAGVVAADPLELRRDGWRITEEGARSGHAPRYARHWRPLDHQLARFPRAGGMELVVMIGVGPDDVLRRGARVLTGLALGDLQGGAPRLQTRELTAPARVALRTELPPGGAIVGVEALAADYVWAARERYALPAPEVGEGARISDLLLLEGSGEAASLDDALTFALPHTRLRPGQPFAVYWELSGLPGVSEEVAYTLTLEPVDAGWFRRALVRLGARRDPVLPALRWEQPLREGETEAARSLRVSPPPLPPGDYRLRLVATLPDGTRLEALRELELVR